MKVAIVYDYLRVFGGGERVLSMFHDLYPEAPIYVSMYLPESVPQYFQNWNILTSHLQKFPLKKIIYPFLIPLLPSAFESFDLSSFDIVISITAGFAKGVITGEDTLHISYTLTVPRFLWGYESSTQSKMKINFLLAFINKKLRVWDKVASDRVDFYFANSLTVKKRIQKAYGRSSHVIPSPVDSTKYMLAKFPRKNYFLIVSRLENYKRIDLAIQVCNALKQDLLIIGKGKEEKHLKRIAGSTISFLSFATDDEIIMHMQQAKVLLFPGADDLGLVPIEAQLCGLPVIAYGKDGALETIQEGVSGEFFREQTPEAFQKTIQLFLAKEYDPILIRNWALQFSLENIKVMTQTSIYTLYSLFKKNNEVNYH